MTSRLKHKLELENVNLKSRYVNESFVQVGSPTPRRLTRQIGTPLPALADAKKDNQEYLPVWEQEVGGMLIYNLTYSGARREGKTTIPRRLHWWLFCWLLQQCWIQGR